MLKPLRPSAPLAPYILRAALVVSCGTYVVWMAGLDETPLLGWLWSPSDVGGLGLGESTAQIIQRWVAVAVALMGLSLLWRPLPLVLWGLTAFQLLWATAMSQKQEGFPLDLSAWDETLLDPLTPWLVLVFPYATEAARIALPLCLWRIVTHQRSHPAVADPAPSAEWLARGAIAITFAAHGIEALQHYPPFVDMILVSFGNLGVDGVSESSAKTALTFIGVIDLLVAVLIVVTRWPLVAAYMAFWGFTTAAARLLMRGWEMGLLDFGVRVAHFALPLVLLVWWYKARQLPAAKSPQ